MRFTSDTTLQPNDRRERSWLVRLLVGLSVVAVLATSCSSDDDTTEESDSSSDSSEAAFDTDAEADFDSASGDAMATEDDDMAEEESFDAEGLFEESDDRADGGLFADEDDPAEERLEDNTFEDYGVRPFVDTDIDNRSTFALDVDTGSYVITRRWLDEGVIPNPDSVRVEEFVNAFAYDYDAPRSGLSLHVDGGPSPFDSGNVLVRVGVQAAVIDDRDRPPAALTFVVDTSGSMDRDDRLGLVKEALTELIDELDDDDTVAIVTYGDTSAIILEPTSARDEREIRDAIEDLRPGGSTNLEAGLDGGGDGRLIQRAHVTP